MQKTISLLILLLVLVSNIHGQLPLKWTTDFNGTDISSETPLFLKVDAKGNVYSLVKTNSKSAIVKYDNSMNLIYSFVVQYDIYNDKIEVDNEGNFLYIGDNTPGLRVCKIDSLGNNLWIKNEWSYYYGIDLVTDSVGNVYVTGKNSADNVQISKYTKNGTKKWTKQFTSITGSTNFHPNQLLISHNDIYVGGTFNTSNSKSILLVKYDSLGNEKWNVSKYVGDTYTNDVLSDLIVDKQGNLVLIGTKEVSYRDKLYYFKTDTSGSILQEAYLNYSGTTLEWSQGYYGHIDSLNNLYIVGTNNTTVELIKYDTSGTYIWHHTALNIGAIPTGITENIDGSIVIAFNSGASNTLNDSYICSYDTAGVCNWTAQSDTSNVGFVISNTGHISLSTFIYNPISKKDQLFMTYDMNGSLTNTINYYGSNRSDNLCIATGSNNDFLYSIYKVFPYTHSYSNSYFIYCYDSIGNVNWVDTLDDLSSYKLHVTDSFIYVVGAEQNTQMTYKINAFNGTTIWKNIDHSGTMEYISDITLDDSSNVYTVGRGDIGSSSPGQQAIFSKFNKNGNKKWRIKWNYSVSNVNEIPYGIEINDGYLYYHGGSNLSNPQPCLRVMKYDLNGNLLWSTPSLDNSSYILYSKEMVFDSIGNIYVVGSKGTNDGFICKFEPNNGTLVWSKFMSDTTFVFNSTAYDIRFGFQYNATLRITSNNRIQIFATAFIKPPQSFNQDTTLIMIEMDTSGTILHSAIDNLNSSTIGNDFFFHNNSIFVSGSKSTSASTYDYFIAEYDSAFSRIDLTEYNVNAIRYNTLATSDGTNMYVTGQFTNSTNDQHIRVLAYGDQTYCAGLHSAGYSWVDNGSGNVSFTNTSTGIYNQVNWAFGDGHTSTSNNPNHTFTINGTHYIVLSIKDSISNCSNYFIDSISISGLSNPQQCFAGFVVYPDTIMNHVTVLNTSYGSNLSYLWDFGDGTTSTQAYPSHFYAASGPFHLCLTITDTTGCTHTYCDSIDKNGVLFNKSVGFTIQVVSHITALNKVVQTSTINLYPNPVAEELIIDSKQTNIQRVNIYNTAGERIISYNQNPRKINVSTLSNGVYIVQIILDNEIVMKKIIKQ